MLWCNATGTTRQVNVGSAAAATTARNIQKGGGTVLAMAVAAVYHTPCKAHCVISIQWKGPIIRTTNVCLYVVLLPWYKQVYTHPFNTMYYEHKHARMNMNNVINLDRNTMPL